MQAVCAESFISVEDYLAGELQRQVRHEYLGGAVYAMAGSSEEHNTIAGNIFGRLRNYLSGKPCRAFIVDMKVRVKPEPEAIFYYPDVMVVCDPRDTERYFKRFPRVLIEVLSPETERTDRREKLVHYTQLETLEEYVLVAQDRVEVTYYRRAKHWQPELLNEPDQQLRLDSIGFAMPLRAVYEQVPVWQFTPLPPASAAQ
ncbi:MAG: Uma2 family endonuclease [Verrucomicrobia bacterium]|nr:Uma2 family endonuclease [Verrucomicrobiota bacterium]